MRLTTQSLKKQLQFQQVNPNKSGAINQFALLPRLAVAWLAGAVFLFALAPYYIWGIALISPAILYALLIAPMSHARAFWIGEIYGMGLWCVGAFWLYTSIHTYGNTPMPIAIGMIAIMGLIMGLFHGLLAVGFNHFFAKQPFSFTALWVVQEWLKTWLFTGFPWLFVGYAFTEQVWLNSLAPLFGVLAMSFVAVFLSSSVVEIAKKQYHFSVLASVMLVASSVLWLLNPAWTTPKNTPNLSVSLIQGNIPQDLKWLLEFQEKTLEIYAELSQSEWGQDIVVW